MKRIINLDVVISNNIFVSGISKNFSNTANVMK